MVILGGANCCGRAMKEFYHENLVKLNLRGISPSLPSTGSSDAQPCRRVVNWPKDDLEPVLTAESVNQFMIFGTSMGTPQAAAAGYHFGPDRCVAFGLINPQAPMEVWGETMKSGKTVPQIAGWDNAPKDEGLNHCCKGPLFFSMNSILMPWLMNASALKKMFRPLLKVEAEYPAFLPWLVRGSKGSVARGWYAYTWALMGSQHGEWGFHPRDVKTKNIALWYASDDTQQLPLHGEILAEIWQEKAQNEDINVEVSVKGGLDHFTHWMPADIVSRSMAQCLLEMSSK